MSTIPASVIVDVTPSVLAAGGTALDLNGLMLTEDTRIPVGTVASFPDAASVSTYFGASAPEVAIATAYFDGFTDSEVKPGALLAAQYTATAVAAFIRGGSLAALTLAALQALSGTLTIVVDGASRATGSISLSAATSFSSAASILQTDLNATPATEASFTGAISTTTLTVSAVGSGTLAVGQHVLGAGVTAGTVITALGTGTGGTGTYTVNHSQSVGSEALTTQPVDVAVTYDSVSSAFVITSGITGVASTVAFATGTLAAALGVTSATGAVLSQGAAATTPSAFMDALVGVSRNWATFFTVFDPDVSGNDNKFLFAEWVGAQTSRYAYAAWDTDLAPAAAAPAVGTLGQRIATAALSGTILIGRDSTGVIDATYAAFVAGIGASIDFEETEGRTTYMFRGQSGLAATASTSAGQANLAANGYNFIGIYATGNDQFTFLANGVVSGSFLWADSYVNQIWLNNAMQLALLSFMTAAKSIPYNAAGYAKLRAALADPINAGINFGAFRPGVTLSSAQRAQINGIAGVDAATTLQNQGWYLLIKDASPTVRAARGSPPMTFFYVDGQSIQQIDLSSVDVQ